MVLLLGSSWVLINLSRDPSCQSSHRWLYLVACFSKIVQIMAVFWPKQGPHIIFVIGASWLLISVPTVASYQFSHCWLYPVAPFVRNVQIMALLWPKHGPHMVHLISSSQVLISAQGCFMPNFTMLGVSKSPICQKCPHHCYVRAQIWP